MAYDRKKRLRDGATPTGIANRRLSRHLEQKGKGAGRQAVPAVRAQCAREPYYTRTLTWCKIALLAEAVTAPPALRTLTALVGTEAGPQSRS